MIAWLFAEALRTSFPDAFTTLMDNDFKTILAFLGEPDEVSGRSLEPLPDSVKEQIEAFTRGELPEDKKRDFFETLKTNPDWIAALAEAIQDAGS